MSSKHELRRIAATLMPGDALLAVCDMAVPIVAVEHASKRAWLTCVHPISGIELIKYDQHLNVSTLCMM